MSDNFNSVTMDIGTLIEVIEEETRKQIKMLPRVIGKAACAKVTRYGQRFEQHSGPPAEDIPPASMKYRFRLPWKSRE